MPVEQKETRHLEWFHQGSPAAVLRDKPQQLQAEEVVPSGQQEREEDVVAVHVELLEKDELCGLVEELVRDVVKGEHTQDRMRICMRLVQMWK